MPSRFKITHFFSKAKDGGPQSPVDGYFLIEMKGLFSIALLKFNKGAREAFHTHAFNAYTWFLTGKMHEERIVAKKGPNIKRTDYKRSLRPKYTPRHNNHRVVAEKDSWCLTIRGPWNNYWTETDLDKHELTTLTHGRKVVHTAKVDDHGALVQRQRIPTED